MKLHFIWPGKTKDERLRSLMEEYLKRVLNLIQRVNEYGVENKHDLTEQTHFML